MLRTLIFLSLVLLTSAFMPRMAGRPLSALRAGESLGKTDMIDILKDKTGISKKDVELVLIAFTETVREEVLEKGKEIRLRDFGTFKQKVSAARVGRNPRTGEELQISGSTSVSFSVSQGMKIKEESAAIPKTKPAPKKK